MPKNEPRSLQPGGRRLYNHVIYPNLPTSQSWCSERTHARRGPFAILPSQNKDGAACLRVGQNFAEPSMVNASSLRYGNSTRGGTSEPRTVCKSSCRPQPSLGVQDENQACVRFALLLLPLLHPNCLRVLYRVRNPEPEPSSQHSGEEKFAFNREKP